MQNATLDSSFVNRLKQILASRYGKKLQIRQLMDISESYQAEQDFFTRGKDLHVPIKVNGSLLGTAIVPSAEDLDHERSHGVAQLIRMVLEPAMHKWYLTQKEANLAEISKSNFSLENLHLFAEEPPSSENLLQTSSDEINPSPANSLTSHLIHLEGTSDTTKKKTALMLHEMTGRWAFVPFNDIKNQLSDSSDISKLGGMTIYVENIETLSESEQQLLTDYLSELHFSNEPLFISTSNYTAEDIGANSFLSVSLIDEMMVNCFDVDRAPLSNRGLREVLELFFFTDEGHINA